MRPGRTIRRVLPLVVAALASPCLAQTILLEAEGFDDRGGWVIDQQFMDQMGSPMLLAHGMGRPVADATTAVELSAPGTYRVWVRTRDWVAPWGAKGAPGKFHVLIDGKPLKTVFGTEGAKWHWQDGGAVEPAAGKVTVALHDLTGFDGRCDAIVLSRDADFTPPNDAKSLAAFRRKALGLPEKPADAGRFDLVVVGGGMAGACAAVSAARLGLDVALLQNRPVLGGNNSSEVRVHLGGRIHLPPYPAVGGVVRELDPGHHGNAQPASNYGDDRKLRVVRAEKSLRLFLNTHAYKVEKDGDRIAAVVARNIATNREQRFAGMVFADCTGDGTIGCLAGADYRMGRESRKETGESLAPEQADRMTMGASVMWYAVEADEPVAFGDCPWGLAFDEKTCQRATRGDWNWEAGMHRDQIADAEQIRDYALRAVYGNWAYLKNHSRDKAKYAKRKLGWVAFVAGKRESRRLLGDVVLRQQDIQQQRPFPDACMTTTWSIDLHYPEPRNAKQFPRGAFRSIARHARIKPYAIPYRCLYSRNVGNLFMAGRNISVTHVALGTVRVMRTTGMMGEVVGMAAAVCKKHRTDPRGVYENHLAELKELLQRGVGKVPPDKPLPLEKPEPPAWLKTAGANLAQAAKVEVSSRYHETKYPPSMINDGRTNIGDNDLRWVSGRKLPHHVTLTWAKPQTIGAVRILTGWCKGRTVDDPLTDFRLEFHDGSAWKPVAGAAAKGNTEVDWHAVFAPVRSDRLRLVVTAAPRDLARIWELEVYGPVAAEKEKL